MCLCRKNGLLCVSACGECHGMGCKNESVLDTAACANDDSDELDYTEIPDDGNIFEILF